MAWNVHLVRGSANDPRGKLGTTLIERSRSLKSEVRYIQQNDSLISTRQTDSILGISSSLMEAVLPSPTTTAVSSSDFDNGAISSEDFLAQQVRVEASSSTIPQEQCPTSSPQQPVSASLIGSVPSAAENLSLSTYATKFEASGADKISVSGMVHTSMYSTYPPARTAFALLTGQNPRYPLPTSLNGASIGNINIPTLNFTKTKPKPTGIGSPLPANHQGVPNSQCSGTQTIEPWIETYTITTTEIEGTITIAPGDPTPSGTYISPLPPCAIYSIYDECLTTECALPIAAQLGSEFTSTVLITHKTTAVSYTGEAVGPIFGVSHITQHHSVIDLPQSLPTAATTDPIQASSGTHPHEPMVISPGSNVAQLPGSVPGSDSDTGSGQGGSTPQDDKGETGISAHPGEDSSPGFHVSDGADQGSDDDGSGTHGENPGSINGNGQNPADHHDAEIPPAVIWNEGTTNVNNIPVEMSPNGVVVGSHTIAPGAGPKTVNVKGQKFTIEPFRVIAAGTTLPLPAFHHQPVTSLKIGNNPVIVHPSDVVIASKTYNIGSSPTAIVHNGQTYLIGPSKLVAGHTTVKLPHASPGPAVVTAGGETFSVFSGQLEAPGLTVLIPSSPRPSNFGYHGQTFAINPSQLIAPDKTFPLNPAITPAPMITTVNGVAISLGPSAAVIGSQTHTFSSGKTPSTIVYDGQTISLGPNGIGLAKTTIAVPAQPTFSVYQKDGIVVSMAASMAVVAGHTYSLRPGMTPFTTIVNGQPVTISPNGVLVPGTTFPVPIPTPTFSIGSRGSLTFSINPTEAVIQGHTYHLSPGATPITTMISGQKVVIGPDGVAFPGTTAYLPQSIGVSQVTIIDGLTFSLGPSQVAISGSTYAIGSGARPTTVTIGEERISIGPAGVGLSDTTIAPSATRTVFPSTATDRPSTSGITLSPATPSAFSQSNLQNNEIVSAGTAVKLRIGGLFLMITLGFYTWVAFV